MKNAKPTPEEIKVALIRSAKKLFLEKGISETEMKAISEGAGLSRSTLYRYMIDKNQLAFIVASDVLQEMTYANLAYAVGDELNGYQKLSAFAHHFAQTLCDSIPSVRFLSEFDSIYRNDYPSIEEAQEYKATIDRLLHRSAQFLFEGLADASIRPIEDPLFYTSILINTLYGLAERMLPRSAHYLEEQHASAAKVLTDTIDILLEHIKA